MIRRALAFQHMDDEPPGLFGRFLAEQGAEIQKLRDEKAEAAEVAEVKKAMPALPGKCQCDRVLLGVPLISLSV